MQIRKLTRIYTRSVQNITSHFKYIKNHLCDFDITWQPIKGDLTAYD